MVQDGLVQFVVIEKKQNNMIYPVGPLMELDPTHTQVKEGDWFMKYLYHPNGDKTYALDHFKSRITNLDEETCL